MSKNKLTICVLTNGAIYDFTPAVLKNMALLGADEYLFYGVYNNKFLNLLKKYIPTAQIHKGEQIINDYANARNTMDYLAQNDYVLHLDMDEIMMTLPEVKERLPIGFIRYNYINGYDKALDLKDIQVRLYDKRRYRWVGKVHEYILGESNTFIIEPSVIIHHFSFLKPISAQEKIHAHYHSISHNSERWKFPDDLPTFNCINIRSFLKKNERW